MSSFRPGALSMLLLVLILSVSGSLVGCHPKSSCDLTAQLEQRAGAGAKDCGDATSDAGIAETDECVVSRFGKNEPFFAEYQRQGTDSEVVFGISSDGKGNVAFLTYDSDPSGGSDAAPVINGDICHDPSVDSSSDRDPATTSPITCASTASVGPTCGSLDRR
jgi:hypothetical protein